MTPTDVHELIENSEHSRYTYLGTRESRMGIEETVGIDDDNRLLNVMNIGPIGHGKTQLMVHAALQDIAKGRGICMITPKGDAIEQVLAKMPDDRLDDVIYLNPNNEPVTKINPLNPNTAPEMTRAQLENQREIIKSDMIDLFRRHSKEWGDQFGRVLETLLRAALEQNLYHDEQYTLVDLYWAVVEDDHLKELIDRTDKPEIRNQLVRIRDLSQRELDPLHRRLDDFVMNETVKRVIDTERSAVDFQDVVNDGKILLVEIQKGDIGFDAAMIIGSIILTQIWAAVQARITLPPEQRHPFFVYIDEVHNFAGDESNFAKIMAEAREYGMGLWLASQHLNQLEPGMRASLTNHCRVKIFFNPSGSEELSRIAGMLRGVEKRELATIGKFRAVLQQPSMAEYRPAVTFDTFPPFEGARDAEELERIKLEATLADEEEAGEKERQYRHRTMYGPGDNAGAYLHQRLLEQAKTFLEKRPEVVRVNLLHQDVGDDRPDGEVITSTGISNLEAEVSTLEKPARVLKNLQRAVDQERTCVFVVMQENAAELHALLADPVNRRGDTHEDDRGRFDYYTADGEAFTNVDIVNEAEYRVLVRTKNGNMRYDAATEDVECPELETSERADLEAFCLYRDEDGHCSALDMPCVLRDWAATTEVES